MRRPQVTSSEPDTDNYTEFYNDIWISPMFLISKKSCYYFLQACLGTVWTVFTPKKRFSNIIFTQFYAKTKWNSLPILRTKSSFQETNILSQEHQISNMLGTSVPDMRGFECNWTIHGKLTKRYAQKTSGCGTVNTLLFFYRRK